MSLLKIGNFDNSFVLKSRRRFIKCFAAGDADGAVNETEASLRRLQKTYLAMAEAEDSRADDRAQAVKFLPARAK